MTAADALFVDTTIHVDRVLRKHDQPYMHTVERISASYKMRLTSAFSKLEFKNVVLMDLQCVAQWIVEENSWRGALERATRMQSRRANTLVNIGIFVQRGLDTSVEVKKGDSVDAKITEQALAYIYANIQFLWLRFDKEVDHVVDRMQCKRAKEGPERRPSGKVVVHTQRSRCLLKTCNNTGAYISSGAQIEKVVNAIKKMDANGDSRMTGELRRIVATHELVKPNKNRLCDYKVCVGIGDLWIHLEALQAGAAAILTRNYKESSVLCELLKLQMVNPDPPKNPMASAAADATKES